MNIRYNFKMYHVILCCKMIQYSILLKITRLLLFNYNINFYDSCAEVNCNGIFSLSKRVNIVRLFVKEVKVVK